MSSFICSAKHFNSVQQKLYSVIAHRNDFYLPYSLRDKFPALHMPNKHTWEAIEEELNNIMDNLRKINAICVTLQYAHHYPGAVDTEIMQETKQLMESKKDNSQAITDLGLYNALRCISYQIEIHHLEELEGMTDDYRNAMEFLEKIIDSMAHYLVSHITKSDSDNSWSI
jgi:hypothetical protein